MTAVSQLVNALNTTPQHKSAKQLLSQAHQMQLIKGFIGCTRWACKLETMKCLNWLGLLSPTVGEEAEAWASLELTTGQWSQAFIKFLQGLVAEEVQEDSTVAITVTWLEPHRKYLVGFDESSCSTQTQKNCEVEAFAYEEWAQIPQKRC